MLPRRFLLRVLFAIAAATLVACSRQPDPVPGSPETYLDLLVRQQQRWQAAQIQRYRYRLQIDCFCPFSGVPVLVEVSPERPPTVRHGETGAALMDSYFVPYSSIDRLFTSLQQELAAPGAGERVVTGQFDPTYGFPTEFEILYTAPASDETIRYRLWDFQH